jgi:hypothetical protein
METYNVVDNILEIKNEVVQRVSKEELLKRKEDLLFRLNEIQTALTKIDQLLKNFK